MNLLVTGASGFLGRNFLERGGLPGCRILAVYNRDDRFQEFVAGLNRPDIVPVQCDLASPAAVAALAREHGAEWDYCLYLAGKVDIPWSVREPAADLFANTLPVLNLLETVRVQKLVYFSSGAVYDGLTGEVAPGGPLSPTLPYAISKLTSEHYIQFHHQRGHSVGNYLIVRFFGAYGPHEAPHKIYTRLIRTFAFEGQNHYTIYGDGSNLIDAMFVDDAIDAIERMLKGDHWNRTVNLAGGTPRRIDDLVGAAAAALGVGSVRIERNNIANERNEFWGSTRDMREFFGFEPRIDLPEGVRRFRAFLEASQDAG